MTTKIGKPLPAPKPAPEEPKVVNIMTMLCATALKEENKSRKPTAKKMHRKRAA
jgi:hypothetical protein